MHIGKLVQAFGHDAPDQTNKKGRADPENQHPVNGCKGCKDPQVFVQHQIAVAQRRVVRQGKIDRRFQCRVRAQQDIGKRPDPDLDRVAQHDNQKSQPQEQPGPVAVVILSVRLGDPVQPVERSKDQAKVQGRAQHHDQCAVGDLRPQLHVRAARKPVWPGSTPRQR